jgi:hypothetical protein
MTIRSAGAALLAGALLGIAPSAASAASPAQNAAFAKQLTTEIKPVFKRRAPYLVLGAVTCKIPLNGTVVHCLAHFTYPKYKASIVYPIAAALQETGNIKWTAENPTCTLQSTGKKFPCSG